MTNTKVKVVNSPDLGELSTNSDVVLHSGCDAKYAQNVYAKARAASLVAIRRTIGGELCVIIVRNADDNADLIDAIKASVKVEGRGRKSKSSEEREQELGF